jgi:hypothetical protein
MPLINAPAGSRHIATAGVTTPDSIDSAYALTIPTSMPGGVLEATVSIEGSNTTRMTYNGTTPTSTVGILLPATNPLVMVFRGQDLISALQFIGTSSGNTIAYNFSTVDDR